MSPDADAGAEDGEGEAPPTWEDVRRLQEEIARLEERVEALEDRHDRSREVLG